MGTSVNLNGTSYTIPATGEGGWGAEVTNYLVAIATGMLTKAGGSFTLTADIDFGANYGIKTAYIKSRSTVSSVGVLRLGNDEVVGWRNTTNSADLSLKVNTSDLLEFGGAPILTLALGTADHVLKMNAGGTAYEFSQIINASIDASAGIQASKLADGSVSDAEFQYLNGVTSSIQTQIDTKFASSDVIDEDNMASDSAAKVPTQQSVKAYVDAVDTGLTDHIADTSTHGVSGAVLGTTDTQTITNKTFDDALVLQEITTPSTPSSGYRSVYPKADGKLYQLKDTGVEVEVGSGGSGSGEINYITNPSGAVDNSDWVASGATIASTTTASELPRENTTATGLKISGLASGGEYIRFDYSLDDVDLNKKMKCQFAFQSLATFQDSSVVVTIKTQAGTDLASETMLAGSRSVKFYFDSGSDADLRLEFTSTSGSDSDFVVSDVIVGAGIGGAVSSIITDWVDFTPGFSSWGSTLAAGQWRRVGENIELQLADGFDTAEISSTWTWEESDYMPTGLTVASGVPVSDTSTMDVFVCGTGLYSDNNGENYNGVIRYNTSSGTLVMELEGGKLSSSNPVAVTLADGISVKVSLPVAEWIGSGTTNTLNADNVDSNYRLRMTGITAASLAFATTLKYTTFAEGTASEYDTSTGVWTAPSDGYYDVFYGFNASVSATMTPEYSIGGSIVSRGSTTAGVIPRFSYGKYFSKGDTFSIGINPSTGSATVSGTNNHFEIIRRADYTAGEPVGFGLANETSSGLISQEYTREIEYADISSFTSTSGTWTVSSGDFSSGSITVSGKMALLTIRIITSSNSIDSARNKITIPNTIIPQIPSYISQVDNMGFGFMNGTSSGNKKTLWAYIKTNGSNSEIEIQRADGSDVPASTNLNYFYFTITYPIG